jgi:hypothetical protein
MVEGGKIDRRSLSTFGDRTLDAHRKRGEADLVEDVRLSLVLTS